MNAGWLAGWLVGTVNLMVAKCSSSYEYRVQSHVDDCIEDKEMRKARFITLPLVPSCMIISCSAVQPFGRLVNITLY